MDNTVEDRATPFEAADARHWDDVDKTHVETATKYLAKALNLIEAASDTMDMLCERRKWNDDVVYQIKDSATGLGFALATLSRWNDTAEDICDD